MIARITLLLVLLTTFIPADEIADTVISLKPISSNELVRDKPQIWVGGYGELIGVLLTVGVGVSGGATFAVETPDHVWFTMGIGGYTTTGLFEQTYTGFQIPFEIGRQLSPYNKNQRFAFVLAGGGDLYISTTQQQTDGFLNSQASKPAFDLKIRPQLTWLQNEDRQRLSLAFTLGVLYYSEYELYTFSPYTSIGFKFQFKTNK